GHSHTLALIGLHWINTAVPPLHHGETGGCADQQEGAALLQNIDRFSGIGIAKKLIGHSRLPVVSPLLKPRTDAESHRAGRLRRSSLLVQAAPHLCHRRKLQIAESRWSCISC